MCRAERSNGPNQASHPFGRAEERRARGGQEHCKRLLLRELACGSCLSVLSEAKVASSAAPPLDRAPEVAWSEAEGRGQWGRLSFAYFSLAEQRRSRCAAGRTSRPPTYPLTAEGHYKAQPTTQTPLALTPTLSPKGEGVKATAACPHRLAGPAPLPRGRGSKPQTGSRRSEAQRMDKLGNAGHPVASSVSMLTHSQHVYPQPIVMHDSHT
ncbi:hypothetical protein ABIE13_003481 [Ottowia thiooxydans]|uniref:Uncharacterized protein n=1 Tax=Ottowia thiooxydans TaxID=219182 RepID=A0ABV2QBI2_9BURK